MHISLDWISDFVDLSGIDPKDIANRLTLATAEVEGVEVLHRFVDGVVVGEVIAAEKITDANGKGSSTAATRNQTLTFCTIDCGSKQYTTVCGAPNVRIGLKAPFAPAGTRIAGRSQAAPFPLANNVVVIEESQMAGRPTQGILCSAAELGMSQWHEIVFECPANIKNGTPFAELVPATDVLIEIDNKSLTHRPDLWGHYGFAREFAAIFKRELKPLPQHDLAQYDHLSAYPVAIDDLENCPCYGAIEFKVQGLKGSSMAATRNTLPSPVVMQRRLHALGQRTYNLLVDVTNYVNNEIGQPTHAFDGDLLTGIRVATAGKNSKFTTLDGQQRDLLPEDLLIWNAGNNTPVALAGIMGGLETEVTDNTTKVLLESANFKAGRIRRTAGRLDLRTDASQRYEKSQPPSNVKVAAARILNLLETAGIAFEATSRFSVAGDLHDAWRTVTLEPGRLDTLAGITLPRETVVDILSSLGFRPHFAQDGTLSVEVPPHRSAKDISIGPDIIEEVLRVYGYDHIAPIMPTMQLRPLHIEKHLELETRAKKLLAGAHGFLEVHNYGWMNDQWLDKIGFEPGETLVLRNPADQSNSRMRTTLMPTLLSLVPKNRTHRDSFRLFELGNVWKMQNSELKAGMEPVPPASQRSAMTGFLEKSFLSGVSYQQSSTPTLEEHYRQIKGAIEDLGELLGEEPFRFVVGTREKGIGDREKGIGSDSSPLSPIPWQTPNHWVEIWQDTEQGATLVGAMGVIAKPLREIIVPEGGQIVWFEIDFSSLQGKMFPEPKYAELPRFPGSWQDFSMVWPVDAGFAALEKTLDLFQHPLLQEREFLVAYKGKGLEPGMASYSFRFLIGADDHTLNGEEIEAFHTAMLGHLKEHKIALR